jgi:hypothetical protein
MNTVPILLGIIDDPDVRPRLKEEARAAITLFSYLGMHDERDLICFLLGQCAGLQDRIDELEKRP